MKTKLQSLTKIFGSQSLRVFDFQLQPMSSLAIYFASNLVPTCHYCFGDLWTYPWSFVWLDLWIFLSSLPWFSSLMMWTREGGFTILAELIWRTPGKFRIQVWTDENTTTRASRRKNPKYIEQRTRYDAETRTIMIWTPQGMSRSLISSDCWDWFKINWTKQPTQSHGYVDLLITNKNKSHSGLFNSRTIFWRENTQSQ